MKKWYKSMGWMILMVALVSAIPSFAQEISLEEPARQVPLKRLETLKVMSIEPFKGQDQVSRLTLKVQDLKDQPAHLRIHPDTPLYSLKSGDKIQPEQIKAGDRVTALIDPTRPMIMIYPPLYSPDAIVVQDDPKDSLKAPTDAWLDKYLEGWRGVDPLAALKNSSLMQGDIRFYPVAQTAAALSYTVKWDAPARQIHLSKPGSEVQIQVDAPLYTFNQKVSDQKWPVRIVKNRAMIDEMFYRYLLELD